MTINWLLILLIYIIKQDNVKPFISFDIPVFYEILQAVYNFIQEKKAPGYFTLQSNACQNNTCLTSDLLTLWPFVKVPIMPNILCACINCCLRKTFIDWGEKCCSVCFLKDFNRFIRDVRVTVISRVDFSLWIARENKC